LKRFRESLYLYQKAAKNEHKAAKLYLGKYYQDGICVEKNG